MSNLSGISSLTSSLTSPKSADAASDTLSKEDFLQLLVAQLQKQDPLNPEDPSEFTSQLTQYSSLEQLMNINGGIDNLMTQQVLSDRLTAAGFIGKTVQVNGDQLIMSGGTATTVNFNQSLDSDKTTVDIYNASGKLIDTVSLGAVKAGDRSFTWDGKLADGTTAADGTYRFEVSATIKDEAIATDTSFTGKVTGTKYENGQTKLVINGSNWKLSDVLAVNG